MRSGAQSGVQSSVFGGAMKSTAVGDATRLEIRPAITTAQQLLKATPIMAIVVMGAFVLRSGVAGLVISVAVGAALMGSFVSFRRRARIIVTASDITRVGLLGIRKSRPRSDVTTVLSAPIIQPSGAVHTIFVLDGDQRPIVRMNERIWALDDMKRLVRALDVRPVGPGKSVKPRTLADEYPRVLRWHERHPTLTRAAGWVVFAAVAAGVVLSLL